MDRVVSILCGTGHRPDKMPGGWNSYLKVCKPIEDLVVQHLVNVHKRYQLEAVMSGMAAGWDTILARATIRARMQVPIKLYAIVPCHGQASKWSSFHRDVYQDILDHADSVKFVYNGTYTQNPACMWDRNKYMVEGSGAIFCYFDDLPYGTLFAEKIQVPPGKGGTRHCLKYAHDYAAKMGMSMPMFNYYK